MQIHDADADKVMHRLSTADVAPTEALDYYAAAMEASLVPMCVHCRSRTHFHAMAESTRLGRLDVHHMVGNAHRVVRGTPELARSDRRILNLMVNRLSPWQLVQRGRNRMRPGDAILIDSAYAHELEVDTYEFINVAMTPEFLARWLPDPSVLTARRLDRDGRWTAPLARFAAQLTPEFLAGRCPLPDEVMAQQLGALLMLAAADPEACASGLPASELALHGPILSCLQERLADIDLTPSDVADSLGLDERTLHRVLAARGQTFTTLLLRLRIRHAELQDPHSRQGPSDPDALARKAGFINAKRLAAARRNQVGGGTQVLFGSTPWRTGSR